VYVSSIYLYYAVRTEPYSRPPTLKMGTRNKLITKRCPA